MLKMTYGKIGMPFCGVSGNGHPVLTHTPRHRQPDLWPTAPSHNVKANAAFRAIKESYQRDNDPAVRALVPFIRKMEILYAVVRALAPAGSIPIIRYGGEVWASPPSLCLPPRTPPALHRIIQHALDLPCGDLARTATHCS